MNTRKIEFQPPQGVVPEGTKAGEEFDLVTTYRVKDNGDICIVMIGDQKMPGYGGDRDKGKPSYKDEHDAMMASGGEQSQGAVGYQTGYS